MNDPVLFNINCQVKVKLTEFGKNLWLERYRRYNIEPSPMKVDENGYTSFQLWDLMYLFGEHVGIGKDLPFETEILIDKQNLKEFV